MPTTDVQQENISIVRRGFEAFANADMAALTTLFHPKATWHAMPAGVLGGTRTGRDDIFTMFALTAQETGGDFHVHPKTFAAAGDDVFVRVTASGKRNGKFLDSDEVILFTLSEGTVRDVRMYMHDHPANEAFWT